MKIISDNIRVRHPKQFKVGDWSIVDDFCYFSTRVKIGNYSHIANGCSVAGGKDRLFTLGSFCSLSSGVKIWCTSDDFVNGLIFIPPPGAEDTKRFLIAGDVSMADYTAVGSNSVIMPNNRIPEGTTIGALSFVPPSYPFKPWSVYAGTPIRFIRRRNKKNVMDQLDNFRACVKRLARQGIKLS